MKCLGGRLDGLSLFAKKGEYMNLPENDYQIIKLSSAFYKHYKAPPYQEILKKNNRPYNCLLFQTHYDYYICIHINGTHPLTHQEFNRRYSYSTLKYFHNELGI